MNKYQQAYAYVAQRVKEYRTYKEDSSDIQYQMKCQRDMLELDLIKELIDEKIEQESRKDKLVVGSKWVSLVNLISEDRIPKDLKVEVTDILDDIVIVNFGEYIFTIEQFMICFKQTESEGE